MHYKIKVGGIPALAKLLAYEKNQGSGQDKRRWESPDDMPGFILDYDLLDRKGYRAPWLADRADKLDLWEDIDRQILEQIGE